MALAYLFGRRDAIETIASDRRFLWVGAALVASAALAREYDARYILGEPYYFVLPFVASLATSWVMFAVIWIVTGAARRGRGRFWSTYLRFLALYWMTAPLAITRAGSVLLDVSILRMFWPVMLVADAAVFVGSYTSPSPLPALMGGIRGEPQDAIVAEAQVSTLLLSLITLPVWGLGTLAVIGTARSGAHAPLLPHPRPTTGHAVLAMAPLLFWGAVLPWFQPAQYRRYRVDQAMQEGRVAAALDLLSAQPRSAFPPGWRPAPNWFRTREPPLVDVLEALAERDETPPWVITYYARLLEQLLSGSLGYLLVDDPDWPRLANAVIRVPGALDVVRRCEADIRVILLPAGEPQRAAAQILLSAAGLAPTSLPSTLPAERAIEAQP